MTDPCETTVMGTPITYDMSTSVFGVLDEQFMEPGTDSISFLHGDKQGLTYCGSRSFSIVRVTPALPVYTNFLTIVTASG